MNMANKPRDYSPGIPLLLTLVLLLSLVGADLYGRLQQRDALRSTIAQQQEALEESVQVRQQFDGLISGISRLAAGGNQVARQVQDELGRRGFRLPADDDATPN